MLLIPGADCMKTVRAVHEYICKCALFMVRYCSFSPHRPSTGIPRSTPPSSTILAKMRPSAYLLQITGSALVLNSSRAAARLVNVTVDDQDPQLQYAPTMNHWLSFVNHDCNSSCSAKPDVSQVHNHTWHDATYDFYVSTQSAPQTVTFQFTGMSSGYIRNIKPAALMFLGRN